MKQTNLQVLFCLLARMYQIESIFIGEGQQGEALIKSEIQTGSLIDFKVGDVSRLAPNHFVLNCKQCSQQFQHFPEFILHIEDHYLQDDVFTSTDADEDFKSFSESSQMILQEHELCEEMELDIRNVNTEQDQNSLHSDAHSTVNYSTPAVDLSQMIDGVIYRKIDDMYVCKICGFKTRLRAKIKSHIAIHVKMKNNCCPICMKGFSSIHYLAKHMKNIHQQSQSTDAIRKAQATLMQIVKPKKSEQHDNPPEEVSKLRLNLLSSNYWRTKGKQYHCPLCIQWFTIPKYVSKHIKLVHGRHYTLDDILAAQIQPDSIPETTESVELVKQQQMQSLQMQQSKSIGKREKSFECFACHTKFVSEKALRYHMPLHEGIQYACPLCDKYFSMQKYVRDHMIYKHGFDKKSKLPPLKTKRIENFQYHKPVVSRFECYLCHRTYPSRSKLNSHMKCHLDVLECNICTKIFKSTESRRRHMQLHSADPNSRHQCLICNKTFPVRRYMMSHMRSSHRSPKLKQDKPPIVLSCEICQKVFNKQGMLNKHMKQHNKEPARYMCDYCGHEFENRHCLRKHLSSAHKISKKFFKCAVCQKVVPKKREEEHMKFHTGEKEHQCELCGSQFVTEGLLNTHKKRQHGGLKYACDLCPERFGQSKKLLHHRRSHVETAIV